MLVNILAKRQEINSIYNLWHALEKIGKNYGLYVLILFTFFEKTHCLNLKPQYCYFLINLTLTPTPSYNNSCKWQIEFIDGLKTDKNLKCSSALSKNYLLFWTRMCNFICLNTKEEYWCKLEIVSRNKCITWRSHISNW